MILDCRYKDRYFDSHQASDGKYAPAASGQNDAERQSYEDTGHRRTAREEDKNKSGKSLLDMHDEILEELDHGTAGRPDKPHKCAGTIVLSDLVFYSNNSLLKFCAVIFIFFINVL